MKRTSYIFFLVIAFGLAHAQFPERTQKLIDDTTFFMVPVTKDISLRVAFTAAKTPTKKVIIYCPGRASYFEKNTGFIQALTGHNFTASHGYAFQNQADVWCIDPRSQGGSGGRLTNDKGEPDQRGHITSFDDYIQDVDTVIKTTILPKYDLMSTEFYLVGSSLGGHIVLRYLQDKVTELPITFKAIVNIVPMVKMNTSPWPRFIAKAMVSSAVALGFGERYAIGYGNVNLDNPQFEKFTGHHNEYEFHDTNTVMRSQMTLVTGGPTFNWVKASFESHDKLTSGSFPKALNVICFVSGGDKAVITEATKSLSKQHGFKVFEYPQAAHNIIKESKEKCGTFWQDLDNSIE